MRSNQATVRNPILNLPAAKDLMALSPEAKRALRAVLLDIRKDAAARAQKSWKQNKGPMACYWKAVSVYAYHTSRVIR